MHPWVLCRIRRRTCRGVVSKRRFARRAPSGWRNFFLTGARELRHGNAGTPASTASADLVAVLTVDQLFDSVKIRVNGPRSWHEHVVIDWVLTDAGERRRMELRNGLLVHRVVAAAADDTQLELSMSTDALRRLVTAQATPEALVGAGELTLGGDPGRLQTLLSFLDASDLNFEIVLPRSTDRSTGGLGSGNESTPAPRAPSPLRSSLSGGGVTYLLTVQRDQRSDGAPLSSTARSRTAYRWCSTSSFSTTLRQRRTTYS